MNRVGYRIVIFFLVLILGSTVCILAYNRRMAVRLNRIIVINNNLHKILDSEFCPSSKFEGGEYYSQYYEDYVLAYVLKNFDTGIYVDVGANNPNTCSVTKYFYLKGWRGINIEPNTKLYQEFLDIRKGDVNLNFGISDKNDELTFYKISDAPKSQEFSVSGLSTFDESIANNAVRDGYNVKEVSVPVFTLDKILETYSKHEQITFVNIDVEGFEEKVLKGFNLKKYKPILLVIESTYPRSELQNYNKWEYILKDSGYLFAMFDGLNRYYVNEDHKYLLRRFNEVNFCTNISKINRNINLDGFIHNTD